MQLSHLLRLAIATIGGYLLGSVLSADIASALHRRRGPTPDLRATGSGNPGAANAMAHMGRSWGIGILAGDIAKGFVAAVAGRRFASDGGAYLAATAAVAGHCFPVFHGFRGGKGVATSVGTALACFPLYVPVDVGVAVAGFARTRHAGRATMLASVVFVAASVVWWWRRLPNGWGPKPTSGLPLYALATSAIIASRFVGDDGSVAGRPATALDEGQ
ncbi:MAG: hypothetical protein Kow0010_26700 [Dehalococcoidia bacterium]